MNLVFSTRLPRISLAALVLVGAAMAAPRLANAEVIDTNITIAAPTITLTTAQVASGFSGYFDVTLTDTAAEHLAQYQATMTLGGDGSHVAIVGADLGQLTNGQDADPSNNAFGNTAPDGIGDPAGASPNLISPYVMGNVYATTNSGDVTNGGAVGFSSTSAFNSDETNSGTITLATNTAFSLMQVYFTIAPGTGAGSYSLTFNTAAPFNAISNPGGDPTADFVNLISNSNSNSYDGTNATAGAINIVTTPEPGSIVLMVLGMVGLVGVGIRRIRRA